MSKVSIFISTLVFALTGCGSSIEHQEVKKAPKNISELGLIATKVTAEQHSEIMQKHPAAVFRNLGNGFAYEYRGLSKAEILEIAPEATLEKNAFISPLDAYQKKEASTEIKLAKFLAKNLDVEFSPENCIMNRLLIVPKIELENISAVSAKTTPEVGQSLGFKNNKKTGDDALTAWVVLPPNGSKITSDFLANQSISFKPDMAGPFGVILLYKKNGQCNFSRSDFFVTNNSPYKAELSDQGEERLETLSQRNFYQISATKADTAQSIVRSLDYTVTKIAVLDSGVNYNNPALKRRMWTNPGEVQGDGIDNDQNGLIDDFVGYDFADDDAHPMDDYGHGSHVSGLVAGEHMGTSAENVQIIAVKVGGAKGPDLGSIISGIKYAIEKEARVINMSFGSTRPTEAVKAVMKEASDAGILIVAASGNGNQFGVGVNNDVTPHYPSSYDLPNILAVGSVRADDALTKYSNFGAQSVDVATVGGFSGPDRSPEGLLSSAYIPNPSGIVTQPMAGTSMASPVAAGIAGLLFSVAPELSPSGVIEIMMSTGRKVSGLEIKIKAGSVLDAEAAVLSLVGPRLD